jgi:hypothetical protein
MYADSAGRIKVVSTITMLIAVTMARDINSSGKVC